MPHNYRGDVCADDFDIEDENTFNERLYLFMKERGSPIEKIPIFDHKELDLYQLYKGVISRGGLETVIENKLWRQITNDLAVDPERTDAGFRLRIHYLKYLYPYERRYFLGLEDDDFDYEAYERHISKSHTGAGREKSTRNLSSRRKKITMTYYSHPTPLSCNSNNSTRNNSSGGGSSPPSPSPVNGNHTSVSKPTTSEKMLLKKPAIIQPLSLANNFKQLDVVTLKKYKKYHKLKLTGSSSKRELTEAVMQHFTVQKVDEDTVINAFLAHVRCSRDNQREREQRRRNASRKMIPVYDDRYV